MRSLAIGAILAGLPLSPLCAQSLDARLPTCFACHGENGTSQIPETPSLGAQPAFYTTVELLMFRDKLRITEPMNEMAKGLTDADLQKAADIISKLPPPQPGIVPICSGSRIFLCCSRRYSPPNATATFPAGNPQGSTPWAEAANTLCCMMKVAWSAIP